MNVRRIVSGWIGIMLSVFLLSGCAGRQDDIEIDVHGLSSELLSQIAFVDELNAVGESVINRIYGIEDYVQAEVYIGSGATAEEIAVFEFADTESAADGLQLALERIEDQKADYEAYIPEEVKKLDRAVVKRYGRYVVVCVSDSEMAEEIITQYINK